VTSKSPDTRGLRIAARNATAVAALLLGCGCAMLPGQEARPGEGAEKRPEPAAAATPLASRPIATEFDERDAAETGELRFQTGDLVKVALWGYPELDHIAMVQPNGSITVPLIGEVPAAEATVAELRQRVERGLTPFQQVTSTELRPGDTLVFQVWHEESLTHTAIIDPSGHVTFPIVGSVRAADRPVEDIRREAERRMVQHLRDARVSIMPVYANRRFLRDYRVSVLSQQLQPRRVAVIGEVGVQGLSDLRPGMRVVEAVAQHQVRHQTAELNSVILIRNPAVGSPRYRVVRLGDYLEGKALGENVLLRNGDIVIVPKTMIAKVGDFVELFFTRTAPVFQWWAGMWSSTVARESAESVRLINQALERALTNISVSPR
jgi:protein involved in polysaccharide export with SLBB domain